jgi:dual specificity MAP kinase phosphatase
MTAEDGEAKPVEEEPSVEDDKLGDDQPVKRKPTEKSLIMGNLQHEELDWIYIGDAEDARDASRLRKFNVKYVLNCTMPRAQGGVMNYFEKDKNFDYCRLAMADNATEPLSTRLEKGWDFFEKVRIREDGGILVHCQQGVSRSVSLVISYLIKYRRFTFDEAKTLCLGCRKQANPNEGFEKQLRALEAQLKATNGFEKLPPPRKRAADSAIGGVQKAARGPSGPARGPAGPPRGPVGPAGPGVGPAVGPARGPAAGPSVGPSVGPAVGPSVGPSVGPAVGPGVGPSVGPAAGPAVGPAPGKEKKDKKDKKEKKDKKDKKDKKREEN